MDNTIPEVISEEQQDELKEACRHFKTKFTKAVLEKSLYDFVITYNLNLPKGGPKLSLDGISQSSIDRAFGLKQPPVSKSMMLNLQAVFDRYLRQYSKETSTEFPAGVAMTLCLAACCQCSNPDCRVRTCGPDLTADDKYIIKGKAHHIRKPAPRKKYDTATILEFNSPRNGIWLCGNCDSVVYNRGVEQFPEELLRNWKELHRNYLSGVKEWPIKSPPSFTRPLAELKKCQDIISHLEQSAVLHKRTEKINPKEILKEVKSTFTFLSDMSKTINPRSPLFLILRIIVAADKTYISFAKSKPDEQHLHYHQSALSKVTGLALLQIQHIYKIRITGKNRRLLPLFKK